MPKKHHIGIRVDSNEKSEMDENSELLDMQTSEYVRFAIETVNDIMFKIRKHYKGMTFTKSLQEKGVLEKNKK